MTVTWHTMAKRQLAKTVAYIAEDSPQAADRMQDDIIAAGNSLADQPTKAPREPLLSGRSEDFRALLVRRRYKLIYYVDETGDTVNIVTLWDTKQHPNRLKNWFFN